ncbi:MAG: hypothetical protein AAGC43_08925 [Bacteroidota bacterium]
MGKDTNSPKIYLQHGKHTKKGKLKKTKPFWDTGKGEHSHFTINEALLRDWLISQGYRRTTDYHVYLIHKGNIKRQNRKDIFVRVINFIENHSASFKKHLRQELMNSALSQCEDILIKRVGILLSLPEISLKQNRSGKEY